MSKTMMKLALAAALVLQMTATPTAHARLLKPPPIMAPVPSGTTTKTLDDMKPDTCCCGSGTETMCTGKDGYTYACSLTTRRCERM